MKQELLNIYAALEQLKFYAKTSFYEPKKYILNALNSSFTIL